MCEFRTLTKDDVELRASRSWMTKGGCAYCSFLIYKDARVDRSILNETVGRFGWQSEFVLVNGNLFCKVSIKNPEGQWISKMDVGTESNTEKEKGQASDAFKRACFAWGIGEELYSSPSVEIQLHTDEYTSGRETDKYGNPKIFPKTDNFYVARMDVDDKTRKITALDIADRGSNDRPARLRFHWTSKPSLSMITKDDFDDYMDGNITDSVLDGKYYITPDGWDQLHERFKKLNK